MNASRLGTLDVEEQAAYWLRVMESPTPTDRAMFWVWIQSSPTHVRELLLASKLDQELESIDRGRRIDVEALIVDASAQEEARRHASRVARAKLRHAPQWFTGIAASIAFVAVAAFLIPAVSKLHSTAASVPKAVAGEIAMVEAVEHVDADAVTAFCTQAIYSITPPPNATYNVTRLAASDRRTCSSACSAENRLRSASSTCR